MQHLNDYKQTSKRRALRARGRPWPKPKPRMRWAGPPQHGYPQAEYSRLEGIEARLDRLEAVLDRLGIEPEELER